MLGILRDFYRNWMCIFMFRGCHSEGWTVGGITLATTIWSAITAIRYAATWL